MTLRYAILPNQESDNVLKHDWEWQCYLLLIPNIKKNSFLQSQDIKSPVSDAGGNYVCLSFHFSTDIFVNKVSIVFNPRAEQNMLERLLL